MFISPVHRRERAAAFADDTDFLDLEEHLTPPSELYAGTGGKPPLAFQMDTKSQKKKLVVSDCFHRLWYTSIVFMHTCIECGAGLVLLCNSLCWSLRLCRTLGLSGWSMWIRMSQDTACVIR